jgi:hypothetical protein
MSDIVCKELAFQYKKALHLTRENMLAFDSSQWLNGISFFEVPARVAFHIIDCLDEHFREDRETPYVWGHRYGRGCDDLPIEKLPAKTDLLIYLDEMEQRIVAYFDKIDDRALSRTHNKHSSVFGQCLKVLRHMMHHQGALNLLAVYHKTGFDAWE